jgi:hypothetical protein
MRVARGLPILDFIERSPGRSMSPAIARLRGRAIELSKRESLIDAAYSYRLVPLETPVTANLRAGGETFFAPRLMPESGELTTLACAVCTIGSRLEQRVTALFSQKQASLAVALDSLGNEILNEVSRRLQDRISADVSRSKLTMAGELRAGDPGLSLEAQQSVLELAQAETIGIKLTAGSLMHPVKTTSMILGVGIDLPPANWSRCDDCSRRDKCRLAMATAFANPH